MGLKSEDNKQIFARILKALFSPIKFSVRGFFKNAAQQKCKFQTWKREARRVLNSPCSEMNIKIYANPKKSSHPTRKFIKAGRKKVAMTELRSDLVGKLISHFGGIIFGNEAEEGYIFDAELDFVLSRRII